MRKMLSLYKIYSNWVLQNYEWFLLKKITN